MAAATATPGFKETWERLPWVTRHVCAAAIVLYLLYAVQPAQAMIAWRLPGAPKWQVWRYILAPLAFSGDLFSGIMEIYNLCTYLQALEGSTFRSRGRTLYYLLWLFAGFNLYASFVGGYTFLGGVVSAMAWTVAQERPNDTVNLMVIPIQRCYLPAANLGLTYLLSGGSISALYVLICGILLAHSFMFFTELLPNAGGPSGLRNTPAFLKVFDKLEQEEQKKKRYGPGSRLR